jgi:superfamily II DNA or RNA helicase
MVLLPSLEPLSISNPTMPGISLPSLSLGKVIFSKLVEWKIMTLGGESEKFNQSEFLQSNILITTYQSLVNLVPACLEKKLNGVLKKKPKGEEVEKIAKEVMKLKEKIEVFKTFDVLSYFTVVNVDEAHKSRGESISIILENCKNWKYRLGLSGTMKLNEQYSDFFKMQQNVGPLVMMLDAKFLIDNNYSPDVKIKRVFLEYDSNDPTVFQYLQIQEDKELRQKIKDQFQDPKGFGKYMLDIEKRIIFETPTRIEFISNLVKKFEKNTLILFSDIKNQYGIRIAQKLKEWNPNTFYIDGETDSSDRDSYKKTMEKEEGTIIVASYGTFATGIDLKNVFHILFAESTKAEITIRQAIGRGMRHLKGKHEVVIWDIIDDLKGYSVKHSESRLDIYKEQKFNILGDKRVKLY